MGGVTVGEGGEASGGGVERVTRGGHGGGGSTCDSGGRGSWWLSGAASVEEGWGGEREVRNALGWRSVFPVGRCVLPSWSGGRWCENPVCASYPVLGALVSYGPGQRGCLSSSLGCCPSSS